MTSTNNLIYIDLPYLEDHVNLKAFNLVHETINNTISEKLKVRPLSDVVKKNIQDSHGKSKDKWHRENLINLGSDPELDQICKEMQSKIKSVQFKTSLLRILKHIGKPENTKVNALADFQVKPVESIVTKYYYNNNDVTTCGEGSLCFLSEKDKTIYLAKATKENLVGYEVFLAEELDNYLGGMIGSHLLWVQQVLEANENDMERKLTQLRVKSL